MKRQKGKAIVMWGSRTLWTDLLLNDLVDELHLVVGGGMIGGGTRIFKDLAATLRRLEARAFEGSETTLLRYATAGG